MLLANQLKQSDSNKNEATELSKIESYNSSLNVKNTPSITNKKTDLQTATLIPTPNKTQLQNIINQTILSILDLSQEETTTIKGRKVFYGDLDKDGDEDVAVEFGWGYKGGSGGGTHIAIFRNTDGSFEYVTHQAFASAVGVTNFDLAGIKDGKIFIEVERENKRHTFQLLLEGNNLVDIDGEKLPDDSF